MNRYCFAWMLLVVVVLSVTATRAEESRVDGAVQDELLRQMQQIIIPEIDFRQANIHDVVKYLQEVSVAHDPEGTGVNIIVNLASKERPQASRGGDPFAPGEREKQPDAGVPLITFSARRISLLEAVRIVSRVANLQYGFVGRAVMIAPPTAAFGDIVVRTYDVLPSVEERIAPPDRYHRHGELSDREWKEFFARMGVRWPPDSSVRYVRSMGKLVVANTEADLVDFERVFAELRALPMLIEIEAKFIAFPAADIERLAQQDADDAHALLRVWKNGGGRLLAAPRVVTRAGREATVKGVKEYIYPTDFTVVPYAGTNGVTNALVAGVVEPSGFETREVGAVLQVSPDVSPEGNMIHLDVSPEVVLEPEWRDYGNTYVDSRGKERHVPMEQPVFYTYSVSTSVTVKSGATVLACGGMASRDGESVVYVFVTARLVGIDGGPLPGAEPSR